MLCKQCGETLKDGAKFCTNCGCKVEYLDININDKTVDEFEAEKQRLLQEELEKKKKEEIEKKELQRKEQSKKRKETIKNIGGRLLSFSIGVLSIIILTLSCYSLYMEFDNNGIVYDNNDIMLKIDGVFQKNVRVKYNNKIYYLGGDGKPQLYKLSHIGDIIKAQDESGNYMKNKTLKIDGSFYHFDENGEAIKNKMLEDCYYKSDGTMVINDWNGDYYYGEDGKMKRNEWIGKFYVGQDGKYLKSSWTPDNHFVNEKGEKVINDKIISNGKFYFIGNDGMKLKDSWGSVGLKKYHTDKEGVLYAGAKFNENGKLYYFKTNGEMLRDGSADGHCADKNGVLVTSKAVGFNYYNEVGDMVKDVWIGESYYDTQGNQVLNGWAQDYYLMNGTKLINTWVDNSMYYVGSDGKYMKNTYVTGFELGSDGKWTGVVDYGLEIVCGNSRNYNYTGNRSSIKRKYFSEEDDEDASYKSYRRKSYYDYDDEYDIFGFASSYDSGEMDQDVNVIKIINITSSTNALDNNQLINMKNVINNCLDSVFENYKSEIRSNSSIQLIDCNSIMISSQKYNQIRLYCNTQKDLFTGSTIDNSFYITYDIKNNVATKN